MTQNCNTDTVRQERSAEVKLKSQMLSHRDEDQQEAFNEKGETISSEPGISSEVAHRHV